jgi:hypothetical protein
MMKKPIEVAQRFYDQMRKEHPGYRAQKFQQLARDVRELARPGRFDLVRECIAAGITDYRDVRAVADAFEASAARQNRAELLREWRSRFDYTPQEAANELRLPEVHVSMMEDETWTGDASGPAIAAAFERIVNDLRGLKRQQRALEERY